MFSFSAGILTQINYIFGCRATKREENTTTTVLELILRINLPGRKQTTKLSMQTSFSWSEPRGPRDEVGLGNELQNILKPNVLVSNV